MEALARAAETAGARAPEQTLIPDLTELTVENLKRNILNQRNTEALLKTEVNN